MVATYETSWVAVGAKVTSKIKSVTHEAYSVYWTLRTTISTPAHSQKVTGAYRKTSKMCSKIPKTILINYRLTSVSSTLNKEHHFTSRFLAPLFWSYSQWLNYMYQNWRGRVQFSKIFFSSFFSCFSLMH